MGTEAADNECYWSAWI